MCIENVNRQLSTCPPNKVVFAHLCVPSASLMLRPLSPASVLNCLGNETEELVHSNTIHDSQKVMDKCPCAGERINKCGLSSSGIWFNHGKQGRTSTCYDVDDP